MKAASQATTHGASGVLVHEVLEGGGVEHLTDIMKPVRSLTMSVTVSELPLFVQGGGVSVASVLLTPTVLG